MAHVQAHDHAHSFGHTLVDLIAAPFKATWNFLIAVGESNYRVKELGRLSAMSDAQLAKRGLTRDGIVSHVFRDQPMI